MGAYKRCEYETVSCPVENLSHFTHTDCDHEAFKIGCVYHPDHGNVILHISELP